MALHVRVVSPHPPGGRCILCAGYAEALGARTDSVTRAERDAHGTGFPSLQVNGYSIQPTDGAILMPADLCAMLATVVGQDEASLAGLEEALEAPLERMLEGTRVPCGRVSPSPDHAFRPSGLA